MNVAVAAAVPVFLAVYITMMVVPSARAVTVTNVNGNVMVSGADDYVVIRDGSNVMVSGRTNNGGMVSTSTSSSSSSRPSPRARSAQAQTAQMMNAMFRSVGGGAGVGFGLNGGGVMSVAMASSG